MKLRILLMVVFMALSNGVVAQNVKQSTHVFFVDDQTYGFGPHAGWLAATCNEASPQSQGTCLGVIWAIIERLESDRKVCLPPVVAPAFDFAKQTIAEYFISDKDLLRMPNKAQLSKSEAKKMKEWGTLIWEALETPFKKKFPC